MANYKKASQDRLRVETKRGSLSVEQLWDLPVTELDEIAVALEAEYKESGGKSFLTDTKSKKDKTLKLSFDIVLDILETKIKASKAASEARENKEHNAYIDNLIVDKKKGEMREMSIEDLEAMRK